MCVPAEMASNEMKGLLRMSLGGYFGPLWGLCWASWAFLGASWGLRGASWATRSPNIGPRRAPGGLRGTIWDPFYLHFGSHLDVKTVLPQACRHRFARQLQDAPKYFLSAFSVDAAMRIPFWTRINLKINALGFKKSMNFLRHPTSFVIPPLSA